MSVSELNLSFSCGQKLSANGLNSIVGKLNSTILEVNSLDSGLLNLPNLPVDTSVRGTVLLFKGFASEEAANDAFTPELRMLTNPTGWDPNSNISINSDELLFMISALTVSGVYQTYGSNGYIWAGPYRIGSSNSTSNTGADDNSYNYIYCRTSDYSNSGPGIPGSDYNWNNFITLIESNSSKSFATNATDSSDGSVITSDTKDKWTDHPLGVTSTIKCEWLVGLKWNENSEKWEYSFGPICISHWGMNGYDGDGFEYIFYLVGQEVDGVTNGYTAPQFGSTYIGKYRNPSGSGFISVNSGVAVSSTEYQNDDFIPQGWQDEPQAVDEIHTKQYVSTRKRQGGQEVTDPWTAFTEPKLWNVYASDGYKVTLDNDTVFVDDDVSNEALQIVSETSVHLWNGDQEITRTGNNTIVTITKSGSYFNSYITPAIIGSGGGITPTDWGTQITLTNNIRGFCLVIKDGVNEPLPEKTEQIIFTLTKDNKTATRILTFEVKNFNEGLAYLLLVTPNTLGINKSGSENYVLRSDSESIKISAISATQKGVKSEIIYKNLSSLSSEKGLYIEVLKSDGSSLSSIGSISQNSGTELTCDLSGIIPMSNGTKYILVNLYYKNSSGSSIKVDSETIDFSIPGNDSNIAGPSGYNSATISLYRRSSTALTNTDLPSSSLYYKFSDRKLYTDSAGNLEASLNDWSYTIPDGTGECYITQSNVSSLSNICQVTGWSSPVVFILNVESGKVGKMFYMLGVWDPSKTYAISNLTIPVVFYEGTEKYYYLNTDLTTTSTGDIPGSSTFTFNDNSELIWSEAENFGLVITEGIFSDFAKLGSAVISGDYIFSQEGTLIVNSNNVTTYNNKPAYTYFAFPEVIFEGSRTFTFSELSDSDHNGNDDRLSKYTGFKVYVGPAGCNSILKINYTKSDPVCPIYFGISYNGGGYEYISITENGYNFGDNNEVNNRYRGKWVDLYIYGNKTTLISGSLINLNGVSLAITKIWYDPYEYFKPNWCVDLKTGKMIAAGGNFIAEPNGNIIVNGRIYESVLRIDSSNYLNYFSSDTNHEHFALTIPDDKLNIILSLSGTNMTYLNSESTKKYIKLPKIKDGGVITIFNDTTSNLSGLLIAIECFNYNESYYTGIFIAKDENDYDNSISYIQLNSNEWVTFKLLNGKLLITDISDTAIIGRE